MDKIKAVTSEKFNLKDKNVFLYMVACAVVAMQPLLDIISSMVINAGKSSFISVSGAVRAILMLLILVYSIAIYNGKYKKLCSIYLLAVSGYIFLLCLMTAIRGSAIACFYMIGLLADTFFFHFAFIAIVELYYTVGRRISPLVMAAMALIYALTLAINHFFDKTGNFNFSSSFAIALAILIPTALVFISSHIGKIKTNDKTTEILSYAVPIICAVVVLAGAVLSNSRPVLFVSVIFSVIFFMWSFSGWRNSSGNIKRRKPLFKSFISSALFCVLILALLPVSPIKSTFDGTFKFSELFYTYSGNTQTGIPSGNNGDDVLPFDDEEEGNDYVPILDSGYDPNDAWHHNDDEDDDTTSSKTTTEKSKTTESQSTTEDLTADSEPAGDESTSEEPSDTTQEETTNKWQLPSINMSDIDNFFSTLPIPSRPSGQSTEPAVDETQSQATEQSSSDTEDTNAVVPPAAIGAGVIKLPSGNFMAINLDRVKYFSNSFFDSNMETWLFGLRFSSLFNEDLSPALKVKSDLFSVFLNYGILGFILYVLPIAFIFIKIFKFILFNFSSTFESIGFMTYAFSAFVILVLSVLDGDVLAFSAVGCVAGVILANTFTLCEEKSDINVAPNKQ